MARHELFIGGGRTSNPETAFFPSVMPTDPSVPSAHKSNAAFCLTRDMDFVDSASLRNYIQNNEVADGDSLGAVLLPKGFCLQMLRFENLNAVAGLQVDLVLHADGGDVTLVNNLDCSTVSTTYVDGGANALTPDTAAALESVIMAENCTIDVLVNTQPDAGLAGARFRIAPIGFTFDGSRW